MKAYKILVYGLVQGVGFRHFTRLEAKKHNVYGYVKNLENGAVEIEVCGDESAVIAFLDWCHKGPSGANVERLEYSEIDDFAATDFVIKR